MATEAGRRKIGAPPQLSYGYSGFPENATGFISD